MIHTMITEYRHTKQITRLMAGSSQLLAILMSKLRSSLGAAWEQPVSRLEYAYSMLMTTFLRPFSCKRAELERRLASDEITAHYIPAPDAHIGKRQCVGTNQLFGNLFYGNARYWIL